MSFICSRVQLHLVVMPLSLFQAVTVPQCLLDFHDLDIFEDKVYYVERLSLGLSGVFS